MDTGTTPPNEDHGSAAPSDSVWRSVEEHADVASGASSADFDSAAPETVQTPSFLQKTEQAPPIQAPSFMSAMAPVPTPAFALHSPPADEEALFEDLGDHGDNSRSGLDPVGSFELPGSFASALDVPDLDVVATVDAPNSFAASSAFDMPRSTVESTPFDAPSSFVAPATFDAASSFVAPVTFEAPSSFTAASIDGGPTRQEGSFDPLGSGFDAPSASDSTTTPGSFTSMFENLAQPVVASPESEGSKSRFGRKKRAEADEFAVSVVKSENVTKAKKEKAPKEQGAAKEGKKFGLGRKKGDADSAASPLPTFGMPGPAGAVTTFTIPGTAPGGSNFGTPEPVATTTLASSDAPSDPVANLVQTEQLAAKKSRFSRPQKAAKAPNEPKALEAGGESGRGFPRKFVIPAAMALVGVAGGGAYVAVSGGSVPTAAPVAASAPAPLATEAPPVESSNPADGAASGIELPPDLALADPLSSDGGGDELTIEAPIEPITVVDEGDPTDLGSGETTDPAASASTIPGALPGAVAPGVPVEPTTTVAAVVPVSAGRFAVGACVKVVGDVNDRTRRVSGASITTTDCAVAHNAEIVSTFDPQGDCERSVVAFVGYPEQITKVAGTVVSYSIVQDKTDNSIYCVANFPTLPDYTGQLFESKKTP